MKIRLVFLVAIALAASFFVFRQPAKSENFAAPQPQTQFLSELKPQTGRAAASGVSPEVRSFAESPLTTKSVAERAVRFVSENQIQRQTTAGAAVQNADRTAANLLTTSPMPVPSLSVEGIINRMNGEIFGLYFMPSDTNGDAGPNHYFQVVNTLGRIYDKNGAPQTPPFPLSNIFAPLGTPCATRNDGLPIVLYDPLADRWLVSQYCNSFPPFRQMIAVSQTGDPLGAYHIYEFVMPNNRLNDYAKFGVWRDGYYMSTDEFVGSDYAGAGLFAFDRAKILRGDPSAGYIYFNIPSTSPARTGGLLPADLDGLNPPPAGAPNIFAGYSATEYGQAQDAVRLFDFHADFANPQNSTFTERVESPLAVAAFDPTSPDGRADIAQPAPGDFLDSQSDRLMYRVAYRRFATHDALVFNQTVRTSPTGATYRAGVRVHELRRTGTAFSVYDSTTYGDNLMSRWMGAAAQDHQGNIAFEYSAGSETEKPSILYSGRLASEPAGAFRTEETLVKGTGVQTAFAFRWGNSSGMVVDPVDDCTFWMTNQYFTAESQAESPFSWLTRIGKVKYAECANAPRARLTGTITSAANGQGIEKATLTANAVYSRSTNGAGSYGTLMVLPDTYTVTASAKGFRSETVTLTLADGQTLTRNFALEPIAVPESAGTMLTAESCSINNAVEPGETVTMNIALRNTGLRDTANLTATLLVSGGVLNPSAAQNYGALAVGGASVARPFTFTAAPDIICGGAVTLTLQLADGAENLGTVEITLNTGTKRVAFQENFDAVTAPVLPAGWTTAATGAQQNWTTSVAQFQTAPNSVFSPDPNQVGLNELVSPSFSITSANAELEFRNWYELETTFLRNRLYDGSVMEIKIGNNNWQDIETAGGAFLTGGYDGTIDSCCSNPLAGRRGWSGRSGINQTSEFITSKAKLPASAAGQNVQLRWRVGTDIGSFRTGQFIDNIVVSDGYVCNCQNVPPSETPFDFDGDGKTDLSAFRGENDPSATDFAIIDSLANTPRNVSWGIAGDLPANADYDGDGKTDIAVFRPSERVWYIFYSSTNSFGAVQFGLADDRRTPADFDGDGRADIAVFRQSTGVWYILQSSNAQVRIQQFGLNGDLPVQEDYDNDGRDDLAVFRPSDGNWYVFRSSDNQASVVRFGLSGDRPVAGDYDGDGRADYVVYRPADRNWYLLKTTAGLSIVNFGLPDDKPMQADFDGDGKRDIAVFRASEGAWYYLRSFNGSFIAQSFAVNAEAALPTIYVP